MGVWVCGECGGECVSVGVGTSVCILNVRMWLEFVCLCAY